jgi:dynein heavy chain
VALIDEQITLTQSMSFSAFKKPFEERIEKWNEGLGIASEVVEEWVKVQRNWLYLQPIFDSPDIMKQLPQEGKRFQKVDKDWRKTLKSAFANPLALPFINNKSLLDEFKDSNKALDFVQKGLSDYLETKRGAFSRFYFLSNDELLEILSETKDPTKVQPHLKKCFEAIKSVKFQKDGTITDMKSSEGEVVPFSTPVMTSGVNVEDWMTGVENEMKIAVKRVMYESIVDYNVIEGGRGKWIQKWPGQCVINSSQVHWTLEMEECMDRAGNDGIRENYEKQISQLDVMVTLVRGRLEDLARLSIGALAVIDVHARDVTKKMLDDKVSSKSDFQWISQLRYYWEGENLEGDMWAMMVSSKRPYGYEYLGNSFRLVITPLTDKCYMTLMGALQMILGGAPSGPAGTGKTETTKDLAKALAKQCIVFNCSDSMDYKMTGKFFKGLASCGAWACFDEFNRILVEVLSVIAQQVLSLQQAVMNKKDRIIFEDTDIRVSDQFAVFITMNPGYAGRTELPDNLKALFRPVAMMVPDYALIGEIQLFAFGYAYSRLCAQKMVSTFQLCSEQLSSQDHYDYGMRAVKSVINAAGNLKRAEPDTDEELLMLRGLMDVNLPKFLAHDLPLFKGIIGDLFPGKKKQIIDYGDLLRCIKTSCENKQLQPIPVFLEKCIQLYEMIVIRHGLMVVGPTGGGKTCNIRVLKDALTQLKKEKIPGIRYETTEIYYINPKSITMGQLYGQFDPNTHEWQDGVLAKVCSN